LLLGCIAFSLFATCLTVLLCTHKR
jgi:hypothetical protein